jgi:hypothetical protein
MVLGSNLRLFGGQWWCSAWSWVRIFDFGSQWWWVPWSRVRILDCLVVNCGVITIRNVRDFGNLIAAVKSCCIELWSSDRAMLPGCALNVHQMCCISVMNFGKGHYLYSMLTIDINFPKKFLLIDFSWKFSFLGQFFQKLKKKCWTNIYVGHQT